MKTKNAKEIAKIDRQLDRLEAEFATIATAHNIQKYIRTIALRNANKQPA